MIKGFVAIACFALHPGPVHALRLLESLAPPSNELPEEAQVCYQKDPAINYVVSQCERAQGGCSTRCCSECANRPGARLQKFARLLKSNPQSITIGAVGNSVLKNFDFLTIRTFMKEMQRAFPSIEFKFPDAGLTSGGGHEPEFVYYGLKTGKIDLTEADVVFVQYHSFGHGIAAGFGSRGTPARSEDLLRALLTLPKKPLVVLVQHCNMQSWVEGPERYSYSYPSVLDLDSTKPVTSMESRAFWRGETESEIQLATYYDIPVVSACSAISTFISKACAHEESYHTRDIPDLISTWYRDPFHYNEDGMRLEGCLITDGILTAVKNVGYGAGDGLELPAKNLWPDVSCDPVQGCYEPAFSMYTAHGDLLPESHTDWEWMSTKDGGKRWWTATKPGALMTIRTPKSSRLQLMFYMHHELGMGMVNVTVDGRMSMLVDACCSSPCVGTPGQGMYQTAIVAEALPTTEHTIQIHSVERPIDKPSPCSSYGNKFDLVGVLGEQFANV